MDEQVSYRCPRSTAATLTILCAVPITVTPSDAAVAATTVYIDGGVLMDSSPDSKLAAEALLKVRQLRSIPCPDGKPCLVAHYEDVCASLRLALESYEKVIIPKALLDAYEAVAKAAKDDLVMRDDISARAVDEALARLEAVRKVR